MQRDKRSDFILNKLDAKSSVTVAELSYELGISEVTVRKLLAGMEQDGLLKRTWGGAVSTSSSLRELSNWEKEKKHVEEKKAIARAAYNCINDGDAIFLDSGTTTIQLARLIIDGPKRGIMVCTNAINIAMELTRAQNLSVIVLGGELRMNIYSCVGSTSENSLKGLFFDKGFITGNHFTAEHGFSTPILQEAELKRTALSVSKEKFVLMDYSKYGDDSLVQIANLNQIDTLITDWHTPKDVLQKFVDRGMNVVIGTQEK